MGFLKTTARIVMLLAMGIASLATTQAIAGHFPAPGTPRPTFYVPMSETNLLTMFGEVAGATNPPTAGAPGSPIRSIISITVGNTGATITWDHWENGGYEADLGNPVHDNVCPGNPVIDSCTQIWGDGSAASGCEPGVAVCTDVADVLTAGDVIFLQNDVPIPRVATDVFFDGGDHFGATFPLTVTRAALPRDAPGSLIAGATEVAPETGQPWSQLFELPLGEDITTTTGAFDGVDVFVMADSDGTIFFDPDGAGGPTAAVSIGVLQGQSILINSALISALVGSPTSIDVGATIRSTDVKFQAHLVAFDPSSTYELRWFQLLPLALLSDEYISPVGTRDAATDPASDCTEVWIFNPNGSDIDIDVTVPSGTPAGSPFTVPAGGVAVWPPTTLDLYDIGFRLMSTGSEVFAANQVVDCTAGGGSGQIFDWGFPLIPADSLSSTVVVGGAPGCTSTCGVGGSSRSVVWVTPVADTILYVDKDGTGITCPGGAGAEETISPASTLVSYRIVDPADNDMTGARIVSCDDVNFAAAYGQDPLLSSPGDSEGLDFGTAILPFDAGIDVDKSVDQSTVQPGTTVTYSYAVANNGTVSLANIDLIDDKCSPVAPVLSGSFNIGDTNTDNFLDPPELWQYTCQVVITEPTVNTVEACSNRNTVNELCASDSETVLTPPTAVTIGNVNLEAVTVADFLAGLGVDQMDGATLFDLLVAWDPAAAAALAGPGVTGSGTGNTGVSNADLPDPADIIDALDDFIDPDGDGQVALMRWQTLHERGTIGFYVERQTVGDSGTGWTQLNEKMLPGLIDAPYGGEYWVVDPGIGAGQHVYRLIEQEAWGSKVTYGPFELNLE